MSSILKAAAIFAARDLKTVDVPVAEWPDEAGEPGVVRLRQLDAAQTIAMTVDMASGDGKDGMFVLLVHTVVDEAGAPVFTKDDIPALKAKSMKVLNRLQYEALKINSMAGDVDPKKA